jgi:hypothetical protein
VKSFLIGLVAGASLLAGAATAQQPAGAGPATGAAPATHMDMSKMSDAQMHEHCRQVMGRKMDGRTPHDHSVDKLGHGPPPARPLSEAEMKKMHDRCAAIMAKEPAPKPQ